MPIRPNFLERAAFFTLNAAPAPMRDLGAAIAYQTISIAVRLGVFGTLAGKPSSADELADAPQTHPRGTRRLLLALQAVGYVAESNGRFRNTPMTEKWLLHGDMLDMNAAVTAWDAFLRALWPHGPEIVRTGERPFDFYEFTAA